MKLEIPAGYRVLQTDERISELGYTYTRDGAERLRDAHPPRHPGYRYEIEQVTRNPFVFDRWAVVAYQNELVKDGLGPGEGSWVCHVCGRERPDAKISVWTEEFDYSDRWGIPVEINIRFCNDRSACRDGAPREAQRRMAGG
jgi:hypothetical protein